MLADVWTWVRLPPAPLLFCIPFQNVVLTAFFILFFGIPWYSFLQKGYNFQLYPKY